MGQCAECERLWKAYQTATIESVQLYEELRSITEDQGLEKLSGATTKAEAAERLHEEARQRLAEHLAATGHPRGSRVAHYCFGQRFVTATWTAWRL